MVNDGAERGVKLAYDFIGSPKKEDNFQNILQTVENDRRLIPNQRKRKLTSKGWSMKLDRNEITLFFQKNVLINKMF